MTLKSLALFAGLVSVSALADEPTVRITSFQLTGQQTRTAELCGVVTGLAEAGTVRIVSDYSFSRPAVYYATVGKDGLFCHLIMTVTGRAQVSVGDGTPTPASL